MLRRPAISISPRARPLTGSNAHALVARLGAAIMGNGLLVPAAIFVVVCWQFLATVDDRPLHRDEARWIHRAVYLRELVDPLSPYWDEGTWRRRGASLDERSRLRAQPPLASYVMGAGLVLQGRDLDTNGFWDMDRDEAWNVRHGNAPDPADLAAGRRTTAIVAALTVVVAYVLATRLTNRFGGLVAALVLGANPLLGHYATFAGSDALLVLLVALAAFAAYRLADRPTWSRALLLGALLGFGGATKLSPLLVAFPLALLGGAALVARFVGTRRAGEPASPPYRLGWQLLSVPVVAGAVFVAVYPYLWAAPLANSRAMLDFRRLGMDLQGEAWPHAAVETRLEAFQRVGVKLGNDWTALGRLSAQLNERFGIVWDTRGIELALAVAGLVMLGALVIRHGLWSGHALATTVLAGQAAVTILGLRADFARYHLPILLLVAVCLGVLAGQTWSVLQRIPRPAALAYAPRNRHRRRATDFIAERWP
ncbi:MAG: glycosyltransferase family 39 protein [Chloroflexia bacterium]|nr:glycosyltransferase family 39 protein [Chloroflexia bacterium]